MPEARLKSLKPSNSSTVNPNAPSLSHWKAIIHIYSFKKFQKIFKFIAFTATCPKTKKAILALLVLLGLIEVVEIHDETVQLRFNS
jgi:hypothetical protein